MCIVSASAMQDIGYSPFETPDDVVTEAAPLPNKDTGREKTPERNLPSDGDADNVAEDGGEVNPSESTAEKENSPTSSKIPSMGLSWAVDDDKAAGNFVLLV